MTTPFTSCIDMIDANNMRVDKSKTNLKGASVLMSGSINQQNGLQNSTYCVVPQPAISLLNKDGSCTFQRRDFNSGAVLKTYNLTKTSDGVLPFDPSQHQAILRSGNSIYPTDGCAQDMANPVQANELLRDFGEILNNTTREYVKSMDNQHASLIRICENLQSDINLTTSQLANKKDELTKETSACTIVFDSIPQKKIDIEVLKAKVRERKEAIAIAEAKKAAEAAQLKNAAVRGPTLLNSTQYLYPRYIPPEFNIQSNVVRYTMSLWVKQTTLNGNWRNLVYFGFGDNNWNQPDRTPGLWIYPSGRGLHFRHSSTLDRNDGADISEGHIPGMRNWYHVLYTVNDNQINGYINGVLRVQRNISGKFIWGRTDKNLRYFSTEWGWPTGGLEMQRFFMIPYVVPSSTTDPNLFSLEKLYNDPNVVK